ncbi:hypothetical protein, partial [Pseudomonas shirazica]
CLRLPAYSASAKVICFIIEKLGDWCPGILPNQEVFFRISLESTFEALSTKRSELEKATSQVSRAKSEFEQNELAIQTARSRLDYLEKKYPHLASKAIRKNL